MSYSVLTWPLANMASRNRARVRREGGRRPGSTGRWIPKRLSLRLSMSGIMGLPTRTCQPRERAAARPESLPLLLSPTSIPSASLGATLAGQPSPVDRTWRPSISAPARVWLRKWPPPIPIDCVLRMISAPSRHRGAEIPAQRGQRSFRPFCATTMFGPSPRPERIAERFPWVQLIEEIKP